MYRMAAETHRPVAPQTAPERQKVPAGRSSEANAGAILAIFPFERFNWLFAETWPAVVVRSGLSIMCLLYSAGLIAANGFNPFIYFKF
jgi:hypothetical protein